MKIPIRIFFALLCGLMNSNNIKANNDMKLNERQQFLVAISAFEAKGDLSNLSK